MTTTNTPDYKVTYSYQFKNTMKTKQVTSREFDDYSEAMKFYDEKAVQMVSALNMTTGSFKITMFAMYLPADEAKLRTLSITAQENR